MRKIATAEGVATKTGRHQNLQHRESLRLKKRGYPERFNSAVEDWKISGDETCG